MSSYKKFREKLLKNDTWHLIARLGAGAFETISGEVVKAILVTLSWGNRPTHNRTQQAGGLFDALASDSAASRTISVLDVSEPRTTAEKAAELVKIKIKQLEQAKQLDNPDAVIMLESRKQITLLKESCSALAGCSAGDKFRFLRCFWEIPGKDRNWEFYQTAPSPTRLYGGRREIIFWEGERGQMYQLAQSVKHLNHIAQNWLRGKPNWGKPGVIVSLNREPSRYALFWRPLRCNLHSHSA